MTQAGALIIGDWGNSNARLWLCAADGAVIDERRGPGIATLRGDSGAIAGCFAAMTAHWPADVPALLAGVVGASFGWRDAGYLPCPIALNQIGSEPVPPVSDGRPVWITPGIRCRNPWGEPDTMRGEELQIAGWVLPGTHCKWARVADGAVTQFHSAISGELFALLSQHSVMVDRGACDAPADDAAFAEGAALARRADDADLAALLFAARARQATGAMPAAAAASFVSGIVVGSDVRTAMRLYGGVETIVIIGAPDLAERYRAAMMLWGHTAAIADGDAAMRAGLLAAARMRALLV
jgi:2-dehydro-3-deoxygalactonokinase